MYARNVAFFIFGWLERELFLVGCFSHLHSSLAEIGPSCLVPVGRVDASFEHWSITERVSKTHAAAAPWQASTALWNLQVLYASSKFWFSPGVTFWPESRGKNILPQKIHKYLRGPDHRCDFFERCHSIVSQREATSTSYQLLAWSQFQSIENYTSPKKLHVPKKRTVTSSISQVFG